MILPGNLDFHVVYVIGQILHVCSGAQRSHCYHCPSPLTMPLNIVSFLPYCCGKFSEQVLCCAAQCITSEIYHIVDILKGQLLGM